MAINHAFMSLAIFSMLIIAPIYWTMCHPKAMERAGDNQFEKLYQCVAHIMPPIACIYNFLATDFIFYRGYARVCLGIAILYLSMSLAKAKLTGQSVYWFLTWNDYLSICVATTACIASVGLPYALALATESLKRRKIPDTPRVVDVLANNNEEENVEAQQKL